MIGDQISTLYNNISLINESKSVVLALLIVPFRPKKDLIALVFLNVDWAN